MLADTVDRTPWKRPVNTKKSAVGQKSSLETVRSQIDLTLQTRLDEVRDGFVASSSQRIVEEVTRATVRQGGRIRPLLCCCGYAACGGDGGPMDERIILAASSLELLHTFAILHDDVMDGSSMRRGEATIHRRVSDEHRASGFPGDSERHGDSERYGVSVAILAGDLALVISDSLLAQSGFSPDRLNDAAVPLTRMRLDAIAGQYLDLKHTGRGVTDPNLTARIARLKTGSYSVEGPLVMGATLAGACDNAKTALQAFARPLGEAFQLTDDLLGMFGDPAVTGKSADNDLRQGKPTSLMANAMSLASTAMKENILTAWGDPSSSDEDLEILRKTVYESGAVKSMIRSINVLVAEAKAALMDPQAHGLVPAPCAQMVELAESIVARARQLGRSG
ncbi:polyprenyl synthetase family protein [soil metagenome]